jgi:histidyl-tRNA synthetase
MTSELVQPRLISGFQDTDPKDMILKRFILGQVIGIFESFGFEPFESAIVQLDSVLFGVDEYSDMDFFRVHNTREGDGEDKQRRSLRFDLTVPLARYVAEKADILPRPFKRWQIGPAFRGEKAAPGRFCQFDQCDVDTMFSTSMAADAEILAIMYQCMTALLGDHAFTIRVNNRKLTNGFPSHFGYDPELNPRVLQAIDSAGKIGWDKVREILVGEELKKNQLGIKGPVADALLSFIQMSGTQDEQLAAFASEFADCADVVAGVEELRTLFTLAENMGVKASFVKFDATMVRGLGYYTGPVFETSVDECASLGSVFSGGRFDNLTGRFTNIKAPGTGASLGIDRFLEVARQLGLFDLKPTVVQCMVAVLGDQNAAYAQAVAAYLRRKHVNTMVYTGEDTGMRSQLKRALSADIPWVIIIGDDENREQMVLLKNLADRQQQTMRVGEAVKAIQMTS